MFLGSGDRLSLIFVTIIIFLSTAFVSLKTPLSDSIAIAQTFNSKTTKTKGEDLYQQGKKKYRAGNFREALQLWQQALTIYRQNGDRLHESETLTNMGFAYANLSNYKQALEYSQQGLNVARAISQRNLESLALYSMGSAYEGQSNYNKAIEAYDQSLKIAREINDLRTEAQVLRALANAYESQANYGQAVEVNLQSLKVARKANDLREEGRIWHSLGTLYDKLGDKQEALKAYQTSLKISRQVPDRATESIVLLSLGNSYSSLGDSPQANSYWQQSLAIAREIGDRGLEAIVSQTLGLSSPKEGLQTFREIGARDNEAWSLITQAIEYLNQGQYVRAFQSFQQSLIISQEIGDRESEAKTFSYIGDLLKIQTNPELAIVFYKQSVNVYESIRQSIQKLPTKLQKSYTQSVANTYRSLADLLLQQDRVLEAQQVLDLLKVQELDDYLRNVRGTGQQLIILRPEQEILQKYNLLQKNAIQLGQELTKLRQIPETSRTPAQQQQITQLVQLQEELNKQFNQFINSPDVVKLVNQLTREVKRQNIDLGDLDALRDDLHRLNAVMLYPLILNDRLELVITTSEAAPLRRTVKVKREELNQVIAEFRSALQYRRDNVKVPAQKLYNWLIKPLEADLKQAKATTIIYAPDGQLRYIPLGALYDGNKWLVQNYRINNITAKSLTNFNNVHQSKLKVLAGAFADTKLSYPVRIGQQEHSLRGLPFAGQEVANLAATISDTTKLLDKNFSLAAIKPRMNEFNIVHFATHAAFVPGQPENSFILFGNGDRPTLKDIKSWTLNNVDLIVLSACETGIGGKFGNGEEILGLGYQFQERGARAVIASLWSVDDGGTQALMNVLYTILKRGNITKAEALRQAQIALMTTNKSIDGKQQRSSLEIEEISKLPSDVSDRLSHPYYWAPFILIGNGL